VTHDMALARKVADRVVFLHEARAAYFGPVSRIYEEGAAYIREFWDLDEMPAGSL
jgi:phospholipid/cholesterol/gamma-HCH transport system ATP-binding protein